jgi:hypothetical protein
MILLADTNDLEEVERDLGAAVGQLITPLTGYRNVRPGEIFAIDNGCFNAFHKKRFFAILERELPNVKACKFVTLPDVVGSARRTLELFDHYRHEELICRYPKALVIQNGQEDLPIPWHQIDAVFIGGDTPFKLSNEAKQIIQCAQRLDKWVHVGRVNEAARWQYFADLGCDSFDGSGISQFSGQRFRIARQREHPKLFAEVN